MPRLQTAPVGVGPTLGGQVRGNPATPIARGARLGPVDAAVVAALTLLTLVALPLLDRSSTVDRDSDAIAVLLVLLAAVATAVRGRWPVAATAAVGLLVGGYLALGYPYGPLFGYVVLTVYGVARHRPLSRSAWVAGAVYPLLAVHVLTNPAALSGASGLAPVLAWVAIPFTLGVARRMVVAAQARERQVSEQRLVDAERLRLSQEVHDVVGHGLAAIQMQADVTLHLAAARPEQTRAALEAISEASREALDELRVVLATVHREGRDRSPAPGLGQAERLCRRVEDAGVAVRLAVDGDPVPLPEAADVVAYRVLQEALTNVLKHSPHASADVHVVHTPEAVSIEVANQCLGPEPVDGVGISGMRRRVTRLGGTFRAGPDPGGTTFRVHARIPRVPEDAR